MKTILDSLTMDDYFSIIDFNHNVRCWSDDLVPGTSLQVGEAKKYIQDIKPNGGERVRVNAIIILALSLNLLSLSLWESGEIRIHWLSYTDFICRHFAKLYKSISVFSEISLFHIDLRHQHQWGSAEGSTDACEGTKSGHDRRALRLYDHPGVWWRPHSGWGFYTRTLLLFTHTFNSFTNSLPACNESSPSVYTRRWSFSKCLHFTLFSRSLLVPLHPF